MVANNFSSVFNRMLSLNRAMDEAVSESPWNRVTGRPARQQLLVPPVDT